MHAKKPLITLFLFAYNQEKYIEKACRAAFDQTYSPLQIIISDDCSTDLTYEIVLRMVEEYSGRHQVIARRNEYNLGLVEHVNIAFRVAAGDVIVAAAGDDISMPMRVERLAEQFMGVDRPLVVHSNVIAICEQGRILDERAPPISSAIALKDSVEKWIGLYIGASGAWSKELYKIYGPIVERHCYEDGVLGFRALILNRCKYIDDPLVFYRMSTGITSTLDNPNGFCSSWRIEKKRKAMFLALMRQRRLDLEAVKGDICVDKYMQLANSLGDEVRVLVMRQSLLMGVPAILKSLFVGDASLVRSALREELKVLKISINAGLNRFFKSRGRK